MNVYGERRKPEKHRVIWVHYDIVTEATYEQNCHKAVVNLRKKGKQN